ncbi:MAG: tetratricopeptide repeat protein [Bryobacteraceae bacterium]|nr:tetratricopeptide repeat protein [Bryobacteraceae bacterium]
MTSAVLALLLLAPDPATLSRQALESAQQKDFPTAERLWKEALAASPGLFEANFNLGYMYQSRGDLAAAEMPLRRAVRSQPNDFNAQYILGAVLSKLNRTDEALKHWRLASALRPDDARLLQILAVEYSKGRYFRDAAQVAEKALASKPGDAALWLTAIKARQDADEHPLALRLAEKMAAAFPGNSRAAFELGYELVRAGRAAEGLPWLDRAMRSPTPWEEPFYFFGDTMLKEGRLDEAKRAFQRALELRREYMPAWAGLARTLMSAGELERARDVLLEATSVDATHPQPHLLLSQVYFRLGQEDRAVEEKEMSSRLRRARPETLESIPGRNFPRSDAAPPAK